MFLEPLELSSQSDVLLLELGIFLDHSRVRVVLMASGASIRLLKVSIIREVIRLHQPVLHRDELFEQEFVPLLPLLVLVFRLALFVLYFFDLAPELPLLGSHRR